MAVHNQYEHKTLIVTPGSAMVSAPIRGQLTPYVHRVRDLPFRLAADFSNTSSPADSYTGP